MNDLAKTLRKNQTTAEQLLWQRLRRHALNGLKFRRQYPIHSFVVDFCCCEKRLVIEVDGDVHALGDQPQRDLHRQALIERLGYQVIRFTNPEVIHNIDGVLEAILLAVTNKSELTPSPSARGRENRQ